MNGFSMKFEILLTRLAMAVSSLAVTLGLADIIYGVIASADGASIKKITLIIAIQPRDPKSVLWQHCISTHSNWSVKEKSG